MKFIVQEEGKSARNSERNEIHARRKEIKPKYDDIYVLLSGDLPLFALRKYTPGCNGLLVKLEANNERVYYSYHPRVCERERVGALTSGRQMKEQADG